MAFGIVLLVRARNWDEIWWHVPSGDDGDYHAKFTTVFVAFATVTCS